MSASPLRATHAWTDTTATIRVAGLAAPVRVLHVTDSHVALTDAADTEHLAKAAPFREKFGRHRQDAQGRPVYTETSFTEACDIAGREQVDLLALTGDIAHFPSRANVDFIAGKVQAAGVPALYTSGNHDWHFPGDEGRDELRERFWPRLQACYDLAPPPANRAACAARDIGGLTFLAVDDSTYQITPAQLQFAREQLARGRPTVLLVHIPISIATLREKTIATWQAPILIGDPDWGLESRTAWDTPADRAETLAFVRLCASAANLVAVLCGHIHFPHADALGPQAMQYVTTPGFAGGLRRIEFLPL
ncbi:MAG: metallophosphoesterase family protein [Planctomycetota bacterium]